MDFLFDESLYFEKLLTIKDGEKLLVNILEEKSTMPDAIFQMVIRLLLVYYMLQKIRDSSARGARNHRF